MLKNKFSLNPPYPWNLKTQASTIRQVKVGWFVISYWTFNSHPCPVGKKKLKHPKAWGCSWKFAIPKNNLLLFKGEIKNKLKASIFKGAYAHAHTSFCLYFLYHLRSFFFSTGGIVSRISKQQSRSSSQILYNGEKQKASDSQLKASCTRNEGSKQR